MKIVLLFIISPSVVAFIRPSCRPTLTQCRRNGLFDGIFSESPEEKAWKEQQKQEAWEAQQRILKKRQETGGFISEEAEAEIQQRRVKITQMTKELSDLQTSENEGDVLESWKKMRDEGKIKTATSGLVRDSGSSRLGSEGLIAERADEKLPYIDQGYVDQEADFMAGINKLFGGFGNKKNE
eukprot:CAMPEP_0172614226 /NCGR_PEP_ID=MMETSP1068-20121228/49276_1 /TAXON_ID=35684 /ORGANISM="Pseudopedinella elastica, Strain CCMP716" /LENGTH=181 /DNA_ID=CAMNT_0013418941 /DNA_START=94 /DNA_END=639 /DNA_ORIENTATION=+